MRLFFALAILLPLAGQVRAEDTILIGDAPLPAGIAIGDAGHSPFAGIWVGRWDSWRSHILVVEGLDDDGLLDVIYSVGRDQQGGGNWFRAKARQENGALVFADDDFAARYAVSDTGRLRGIYPTEDHFAVLERQELSAMLAAPTDDWFQLGRREFLMTDMTEDGKPIELAVAMYLPDGDGPFPLALVHHGSTGSGTNPRDFEWFFTHDWFADLLNAHGWVVAFPQRRGRGGSDGLYDEGFSEDRSQGYSTEARLSLPGATRALIDANAALAALRKRPEVSNGAVLFSGVSRGGVVALMQAGDQPEDTAGVINFVGGWMTESPGDPEINPTLFRRVEGFDGTVLSIYGEDDPLYSIDHSRSNLARIEKVGAENEFHIVTVPGFNRGHWVMWWPMLWEEIVSDYLQRIESRP
ncbi:alpha/beta hydrolase family protein [Phaeobacter piscinae]|uniref:alpha/beta hydrolase family protein n=1 Tax=Phaeobacter piscinae TaxID=1580596 RepID=UPI000C9BB421|nr:CocE/NonD family hydrolase [Phaeobacter piscinae]AUQ74807.1 Dienelactone hydrolase [Phaeobacter piscinae]